MKSFSFNKSFFIRDSLISRTSKPFLIAEVAQAHDGSLGFAHSYIDLVASLGIDAIKFQTHLAEFETTTDDVFRVNFSFEDKSRYDYWQRMEFTYDQWVGLYEHCCKANIVFLSSAFSIEAFNLLEKLNIPAWKVASGEISNHSLLDAYISTKKPILLSSGMSTFDDIDNTFDFLSSKNHMDVALFQCTTSYPTSPHEIGLNVINHMIRNYNIPIGLSDHSGDPLSSICSMALGASLIEAHICFSKSQFGPDSSSSLTPDQFLYLSKSRDSIFDMLSNPVDKSVVPVKQKSLSKLFGRSLALKKYCKAGTVVDSSMLTFKKPGSGLQLVDFSSLKSTKLVNDVPSTRLLRVDDFEL